MVTISTLWAAHARAGDELTNLVYSEASPVWASQISQFLSDPGEVHVTFREDGAERRVVWLNYVNPQRRMIRSESSRFIHVYAVNDEYAFDIAARSENPEVFWMDGLKESTELATPPESFDLFLPEATFMGYPLTCLVRRDLVSIRSVEADRDEPSRLWISARVNKSEQLAEVPFVFFTNQFLEGTDIKVSVAPERDWRLVSATVTYPDGTVWHQSNSVEPNGQILRQVDAENGDLKVRTYSSILMQGPESLRPLDESAFYLSHYGLSESTAGFLMGSRQYILVFCALFFGAIFFRVLASVLKRRRTKNTEATA